MNNGNRNLSILAIIAVISMAGCDDTKRGTDDNEVISTQCISETTLERCDDSGNCTPETCSGNTPVCKDGECVADTNLDNKCVSGTKTCVSANTAAVCGDDGKLVETTCSGNTPVCKDGECVADTKLEDDCVVGTKVCVSVNTAAVCGNDGKFVETTCTGNTPVCKDGECVEIHTDNCNEGQTECHNGKLATCMENTWRETSCPTDNPVCSDGKCVECEGSEVTCADGSSVKMCQNSKWNTTKCPDNKPACVNGNCLDGCENGTSVCVSNTSYKACIDQQWSEFDQKCPDNAPICKDGKCIPECEEGTKECLSNQTYKLCKDGRWTVPQNCADSTPYCDKTECIAECQPDEHLCIENGDTSEYIYCNNGRLKYDVCPITSPYCSDTNECAECKGDEIICDTQNSFKKCQNGHWSASESCPSNKSVCSSGECKSACDEGAFVCDGANQYKVCQNGNWVSKTCESPTPLCSGNKCIAECKENTISCLSETTYRACEGGKWSTTQKSCSGSTPLCSTNNSEHKCVAECVENSFECLDDSSYRQCKNGRWSTKTQCNAPTPFCRSSLGTYKCVAECTENASRCSNYDVETCIGGRWTKTDSCSGVCLDGKCYKGECASGNVKCVNNAVSTCVNTEWTEAKACSADEICQDGICEKHICSEADNECLSETSYKRCEDGTIVRATCPSDKPYCLNGECHDQCSLMSKTTICSDDGWNVYTCKDGEYTYSRCEGDKADPYYTDNWGYYNYYGQETMQGFCHDHKCETSDITEGTACNQYDSPVILKHDGIGSTRYLNVFVCSFDNKYHKTHQWSEKFKNTSRKIILSNDKKGFTFFDSDYYNAHNCKLGAYQSITLDSTIMDADGVEHSLEVCRKCVDFEDGQRGFAYYTCPADRNFCTGSDCYVSQTKCTSDDNFCTSDTSFQKCNNGTITTGNCPADKPYCSNGECHDDCSKMTSSIVCSDDGWNMYSCTNGRSSYSRCEGTKANPYYTNNWDYYSYYGQNTMQGFCNYHNCETNSLRGDECKQYVSPVILETLGSSYSLTTLDVLVCSYDNKYHRALSYNYLNTRKIILSKDKKGFAISNSDYYREYQDCTLNTYMTKETSETVTDSNGITHPIEICLKCVDFEDDHRGYAFYTCPEP